jgi:hypothetical protein
MPLIVLLVYYALLRVHQHPALHPQPAASQISTGQTSPPQAPR